jgi:hypothetical protein
MGKWKSAWDLALHALAAVATKCVGGHCRRLTFHILVSPTSSDWGCLPQFPTKSPSRTVARCGAAVWDSFMVYAWWFGALGRMRWTNSMAYLFPWFSSITFLSLRTSEVSCWCYRSQWCQDLQQWMQNDLYNTCKLLASQDVAIKMCNILCWSWRWKLWAFSLIFRRP